MSFFSRHGINRGFTIVELLIVIVVIAILASVSVIAYSNIVKGAKDAAVLSDSETVEGEITRYGTKHNGSYGVSVVWYSQGSANPNLKVTPSGGNIIDVVANSTSYCIRTYNSQGSQYVSLATAFKKGSTTTACNSLSPSTAAHEHSPIQNEGVVTFLAGSGSAGSADGTGAAASFNFLSSVVSGIASDSQGNLFVADYSSNAVRKITSSGGVTTLGTVYRPSGLVVDSQDNVYASSSNANIRKITPAGVTTIFVGSPSSNQTGYVDANGTLARFGLNPGNLVIDADDNIYVADGTNSKIRKVTPSGDVTTIASVTGSPRGMTIDASKNIYLVTSGNSLKKITPAGVVTQIYYDSSGNMSGLTIDINNNLYVSMYSKVIKVTQAGVATDFVGNGTAATVDGTGIAAQIQMAHAIGSDRGGTMYIIESGASQRVRKIQ